MLSLVFVFLFLCIFVFFFFFSSRRRHTRLVSDWSSDVCSSDLDSALLIGIREEQAMIADGADEPWDPPRVFADAVHRGIGEQPHVTCPRDAQSRPDIFAGFLRGQRGNLTAQADPLLELTELGETERLRELRLAH